MNRFNGNPTIFQGLALTVQVAPDGPANFIQDTGSQILRDYRRDD
jgi:hypothetical protein